MSRAVTPAPLRLRRGVPVLARPPGLLQVGADPHQRLVLPDTGPVRELLGLLSTGGAARPRDPELVELTDRLLRAGLVVDVEARTLVRRLRAARPVRVQGPDPWTGDLVDLLTAAGVRVTTHPDDASARALLTVGEPDREVADAFVADAVPTLFVSVVDARVRVGPFVVPGLTACLRCLDAHARDRDLHGPLPAVVTGSGKGHDYPLDQGPTAMTLALSLAAGDLQGWVEGRKPGSWSASTWIADDLARESVQWTRHPHCGCAWQDQLRTG